MPSTSFITFLNSSSKNLIQMVLQIWYVRDQQQKKKKSNEMFSAILKRSTTTFSREPKTYISGVVVESQMTGCGFEEWV